MAKSRVAPLKLLTLPRLELTATLVATRLLCFVLDTLSLQDPPVYIWSDSQIVLHWVQSKKQLPAFVQRRVSEMKSQHPTASWRYCLTLKNPADLLTRGTTFQLLKSSPCGNMAHRGSPHQVSDQCFNHLHYHPCSLQQLLQLNSAISTSPWLSLHHVY